MPLTETQARETHCYSCRRPLNEIIGGFIPRRCNACGAVMPTEAINCPTCGATKSQRFHAAVEGFREQSGDTSEPAERRSLERPLVEQMPAGWYVSETYMSDDLADFIIETAIRIIFGGTNSSAIYETFDVGISLRISDEDRKAARGFVRRLFRVH
jgi:hypothetical protein